MVDILNKYDYAKHKSHLFWNRNKKNNYKI